MNAPVSRKANRLLARARDAAAVRGYHTHPDVAALEIERAQRTMSRLLWVALMGGLAYTMVNVQQFAAAGEPVGSPMWMVAWVLDPIVSLVLIGVLRGEQVMARYQISLKPGQANWIRRAKWMCLAATYVMNTWSSWAALDAAGVVLHSVPPAIVFVAAEVLPQLRSGMTDATWAAHAEAARLRQGDTATSGVASLPEPAAGSDTGVGSWLSRMVVVSGRDRVVPDEGDTPALSEGEATGDTAGATPDSDVSHGTDTAAPVAPDVPPAVEATHDTVQATPANDMDHGTAVVPVSQPVVSLADMAEREQRVVEWLRHDPDMSGAEIGRRIGQTAKTGQRLRKKLLPVARQQRDMGAAGDTSEGDATRGWRVKEIKSDSDTDAPAVGE